MKTENKERGRGRPNFRKCSFPINYFGKRAATPSIELTGNLPRVSMTRRNLLTVEHLLNLAQRPKLLQKLDNSQCDQIGRRFGFWATF